MIQYATNKKICNDKFVTELPVKIILNLRMYKIYDYYMWNFESKINSHKISHSRNRSIHAIKLKIKPNSFLILTCICWVFYIDNIFNDNTHQHKLLTSTNRIKKSTRWHVEVLGASLVRSFIKTPRILNRAFFQK